MICSLEFGMMDLCCVSLLYVSVFSIGLFLQVYNAGLRKVITKLRNHHSSDVRDTRYRHEIMEWGRLWGEVHLYREGPTSGGRVRKQERDTSCAILTQKPRPETQPQFYRGKLPKKVEFYSVFTMLENDAESRIPHISKWYVAVHCSCFD